MTGIASILAMSNLKSINNLKMAVIGLVLIIIVYYIKDFSADDIQLENNQFYHIHLGFFLYLV